MNVEPLESKGRKRCVFPPWDLLRGRDVFVNRSQLISELDATILQHWAPNCGTFSRARERPIPGVANPPPPLRSDQFPEGIPEALHSLPASKKRKLDLDTQMADLAASECLKAHRSGRYFTLENPKNSIARKLDTWKRLEGAVGVMATEYHTCMFEGSRRRKAQVLIHNYPPLQTIGRTCDRSGKCDRTSLPHLSWRPRVVDGKVTSFATSEEREYPQGFCEVYSVLVGDMRPGPFVEVFSGRNAPLSSCLAKSWKVTLPTAGDSLVGHLGERVEFSESAAVDQGTTSPIKTGNSICKGPEPASAYRTAAVQAAKQPSYGKRTQLIPDGMLDPSKHLSEAKRLSHPFDSLSVLKQDHLDALKKLRDPQSLIAGRFESLDMLKSWVADFRYQQMAENRKASWTARKLGCKPNTLVMERLQTFLNIEDTEVPSLCLQGLRITGAASESPFFEEHNVPPAMKKSDFLADLGGRSRRMIERVKFMAEKGDPNLAKAIWDKTQKEVTKGTMGPPLTLSEVERRYKGEFQVTPSFGLAQGHDDQGNPKYRRIDDYTASGVNPSAHRKQKVPMCMVDYIGVMLRSVTKLSKSVELATEDMASAYRQVPLAPEDVRYAITGVYNPSTKEVDLHEMYGQPFGAGHAVPNFYRVSEWIARCLQRLFHIHLDHFFDDFFIIEPRDTIRSAVYCMQEAFKLLGFALDPTKSQPPTTNCPILGVLFDTSNLSSQGRIIISPKPSRVENLCSTIDGIITADQISSTVAASIVGKFGFLCSTLFGKVGRCCTGPLRQRQYSRLQHTALTPSIRTSLKLMQEFLRQAPSRELLLLQQKPVVLYTDASDVPGRTPQRLLGALLYDPLDNRYFHSSWAVPTELVAQWIPKKSQMGQLELLAAPFAFSTWSSRLSLRPVILFIDNDSAASNLVKGYSQKEDSTAIVGLFWLMVSSMKCHLYIDRVESKSNPADGPSRNDFTFVRGIGSHWTVPRTGTLGQPSDHLPLWFGAPTAGGQRGAPPSSGGSIEGGLPR